jgi:hypothetical protein
MKKNNYSLFSSIGLVRTTIIACVCILGLISNDVQAQCAPGAFGGSACQFPSFGVNGYITTGIITTSGTPTTFFSGGTCAGSTPFYSDLHSSVTATVTQNLTYTLTFNVATAPSSTYGTFSFTAWVDFNDNGVFTDAGENIMSTSIPGNSSTNTSTSASFTISANPGAHRFRVKVGNLGPHSSCSGNASANGQTDDFTMNVLAGTPCSGIPASLAVVPSSAAVCPSATQNISLALDASGYTYQWQQSNASAGTYANVTGGSGATTAAFTTPLGSALPFAPTFYRCNVTCTASGQTTPSQVSTISLSSFLNCYCIPTGNTAGASATDNITNVNLVTNASAALSPTPLNNTTTFGSSPFYTLYGASTPFGNLIPGSSYILKVTKGSNANSLVDVWFDWNQDGTFGTIQTPTTNWEYLGRSTAGASQYTYATFTVPATALSGVTVMRVIEDRLTGTTNPCAYGSTRGETEDYRINIASGCAAPANPASGINFSNVLTTSNNVNWTRGNGDAGVIVVARLSSSTNTAPLSGTAYTANASFGSGTQIGTGNYVVYQGAGTTVNVTNLLPSTNYVYSVYEYNSTGLCYGSAATGNQTTASCSPSAQPSGFTVSCFDYNTMTLSFNRGNGTHTIVLAKAITAVDADPVYNVSYTANTAFGSGSQIGTGNYVVYNGNNPGTVSLSLTGLTPGVTYSFKAYEYNASPNCYNYVAPPTVSKATRNAGTYTSSTTTQNTSTVIQNSLAQQIIGLQVVVGGGVDPAASMNSITFTTAGTTNTATDLINAKIFYTGTSSTFASNTQFGSTFISFAGNLTATGNFALLSGTNYFWVAYDLKLNATVSNVLDATIVSFNLTDNTGTSNRTPSVTAPAGSRAVIAPGGSGYCTPSQYNSVGDNISSVSFAGNSYPSSNYNTSPGQGYQNFTSDPAPTVNPNGVYTLAYYADDFIGNTNSAYIDWNQNGTFGDVSNEQITINHASFSVSLSVTVPAGALPGATRLRIVNRFPSAGSNPCIGSDGSSTSGLTSDYTVNVSGGGTQAVSCATLVPTVSTPVNYAYNASASQLSASGTGLLWYTASSGGVGSGTAPTPVTTASGTTAYYVSQTNTSGSPICEGPRTQIAVVVGPQTCGTPAAISTCGSSTPQGNDVGQCGAIVNYTNATASGVPAPTVTYSQNSGTSFPVGTTTVTVTATNTTGTATCQFSVVVTDTQAPTISCPGTVTTCSATPALGSPTTGDNCTGTINVVNNAPGSFPVGLTVVTWTATDATGNTAICTQNVTRSAQPTASAGGTSTICETGTATVSGASSSNGTILWTHNGNGSLTNATTDSPTYTPGTSDAGTTVTLTMTVSNPPCSDATATYSVIVNATPTASAGGASTICETATATVSGASSSNGTILWTHNGNGSLTGATTLTPTYTPGVGDGGTTVTLTMTVSNAPCTPATATYSVNVSAAPTASAGGSSTICENGTATVSGASSSNGTILWTHNGNGSLTGAGILTPTYTPGVGDAGTTVTLTLTVSNAPCTPATATYAVNISAAPTASAGGSSTICATATATVSGASSSNGAILWTHNGNGSLTNATTLTPTYTPGVGDGGTTVTLTMTVSNAPCTPATATYSVNISSAPTASAGGSSTICQSSNATVSGASSSNGTILWTHNGNGSLTNATTLTPTYIPGVGDGGTTVTLTMTVSNAPCTPATATYAVNVSAGPTASAGGSSNICGATSGTVSGASSSNGTILWTHNGVGTLTNANTNSPTYNAVAGDIGNNVTLTMTVSNPPCPNATATYTMHVRALPTATVMLTGSSSICLGQVTQVTVNFTGPISSWNYQLSDGTDNYPVTGETNSSVIVQVTPPSAGTHTYTVSTTGPNTFNDGTCNGTTSGSAVIKVNTSPPANSITFISGGIGSACNGDIIQLNTNNVSGQGILYNWNQGSNSSLIQYGPTATGPWTASLPTSINTVFAKFGTITSGNSGYNICVFASNGCTPNTNNKCQFIRGTTSAPGFINGSTTVCSNASPVSYTAETVTGATTYTWSFPGATFTNQGSSVTGVNYPVNPSGQLCVTAAVSCNNSGVATQSPAKCVTIGSGIATPAVITGPANVCPGSATQYTFSVPNDINASSYVWTLPSGVVPVGSATLNSITVQVNSLAGTPNICVKAVSTCGTQSASRCKGIATGIPATPSNIGGPLKGVCSGNQLNYSVVNVPGTTYTWSIPAAATGFSGQGSSLIHFFITGTPAFGSGNVSVTATNGPCGASSPRSIVIYGPPDQPATITSNPDPVCADQPVSFTASTPVGAGPIYTWSISGGSIINTPPYSNSINVIWGGGNGTVTASGKNSCGIGGAKILNVVPGCREENAAVGSGSMQFAIYPNPAHDQLTLSIDAKESAVYNVQLADLAGRRLLSEDQSANTGMNTFQLDLTHLAKGVYMLTVQSAGGNWKARVVVE